MKRRLEKIHAWARLGFLAVIVFLQVSLLQAQPAFDYGNGWYVPTQQYVKLLTWQDGVHRVLGSDLQNAGFTVNAGDLSKIQMYFRGRQQYIHVQSNGGTLEYIEFYGRRNDGAVDSLMYRDAQNIAHRPGLQPIERLSIYTDTAAFFLTVGAQNGLRVSSFNDQNFSNYSPASYFRYENYHHFHPGISGSNVSWNPGGGSQYEIYHSLNSYFVIGEGYIGPNLAYGGNLYVPLQTPHAANVGNPSEFSCRIFGRSTFQHILSVTLDGNQVIYDSVDNIYIKTRTVSYNQPLGNTLSVIYNAHGQQAGNTDNNNYCWSSIRYDRLFNMDGASAIKMIEWNQGANAYFRFTNTGSATDVVAWDLTNHQRSLGVGVGGNEMRVVVPGAPNDRVIEVAGGSGILTPVIEPALLSNLSSPSAGAEFIIITHKDLSASANAYKNYRDTCSVNQLDAKVVYIDEIIDEFGHGSMTPWAVKRFCKYAIDNWTVKPKYFFIWGKGKVETRGRQYNYVPTAGDPPCDYEFVSDFDNQDVNVEPEVPIGRVNIFNDQEGMVYLAKVNVYEHTPWAPWMKHSVFLGGGNQSAEQSSILAFFKDQYKPIWEGAPLGGTVNYYQKFNTGLISNSLLTSTQRINEGCAIIHFFGHSSSNIYDVDIQEPVLYTNYNKMPLMIAYGCYGGNFGSEGKSFGERFVLQPDRGSIGYLANSTAGFLLPLGNFGQAHYEKMLGVDYGKPIGDIVKSSIGRLYAQWSDMVYVNHCKQMNLQCDPSIRIYSPEMPDLAISEQDIFISPSNFSASDSSFQVNFVVRNLGKATQDSCYLSFRHLQPGNAGWVSYPSIKIPPISSIDTFTVTVNNTLGPAMAGINMVDVFVDSTLLIQEYSENNNRIQIQFIVPGNSPAIVFPYDYAVIPGNTVKLTASAYVLSSTPQVNYQFEIDTVPDFTSGFKIISPVISGTSAFGQWQVPATLTDSMVYYWRVRLADIYPATWASASFKYIQTRQGWAQSVPPQYFRDPTSQITMNQVQREWEFDQYAVELAGYVVDWGHSVYRLANGAFFSVLPGNNSLNGVMVTPIRHKDLIPSMQNTSFGDWMYLAMPDAGGDVAAMVSSLAQGDYLLMMSERDAKVSSWPPAMVGALQSLGVDVARLQSRAPGEGFIVLARKGYPAQVIQIDQPNVYDSQQNLWRYDLRVALNTNHSEGQVKSTLIGPAKSWSSLIWDWTRADALGADKVNVSVYASADGLADSLVMQGLPDGTFPLTGIDANRYPYLRLEADVRDSMKLTAPQLDNWHVIYSPAPDAAIEPTVAWRFMEDTLMAGQAGRVEFTVRNVSDFDMDSVLVKFAVRRADRSQVELGTKRFKALPAGSQELFTYDFMVPSTGLSGNVVFKIEVNPNSDQPELYHFNNLYDYPFYITNDRVQPILDVTVDGRHVINGDIISPTPEILIEINDENEFLAVNDTAFEVHFGRRTPNPANLPRLFIQGNDDMEVVSASLPANKAKLYFRPERLEDGEYTLRVQGYDQTGNSAGKTNYEVNFKVVNESAVSNVLNYPNPFSTSTRFVYTLTGDEIPEVFQIHIFTITGKLIKVIDLAETNDIRVGYYMTEYEWDGRDEFGDLLANGVYLYKVVVKSGGKAMKHREEGVSQLFNNGFGKMYIMR